MQYNHVTRFSDNVDLWIIKIKSLWSFVHVVHRDQVNRTRNTWISSENVWKVCLFYSQNNKIFWWSNVRDTFSELKVCGLSSWFWFWDADHWLGRQALQITWQYSNIYNKTYLIIPFSMNTSASNIWSSLTTVPPLMSRRSFFACNGSYTKKPLFILFHKYYFKIIKKTSWAQNNNTIGIQ